MSTTKRQVILTIIMAVFLLAAALTPFGFTVHAEGDVPGILIENGMAQESVAYSDPLKEDYSNENSEILRFCVYVETDYDTDLDGKPDLVKTLVQVPRSAAKGEYKAPVIYEASPYIAGMSGGDFNLDNDDPFDESLLHSRPEKRKVSGISDTFEAAASAKKEDWSYKFPPASADLPDDGITNLKAYDDFLVRGYAVVLSAGIGTYGSEGIECCGSVMERDAFKSIAEWLHGDRKAFTDKENNIEIKADWSSGKIGMIGFSYSATMAYEVASTGVPGVETIVDCSGISSWYDYINSQGICTNFNMRYDYLDNLDYTCASRFFVDYDQNIKVINDRYLSWLRKEQDKLRGDYGDFWAADDYYTGASDLHASALIVHGLNDRNVKTKQFDLMRTALLKCGCEVKTILHQNSHQLPWNTTDNTEIMIGEHTFTDWLNLWFTHYLLGVENEVSDMPDFMVQSNVNGEFFHTDDWDTGTTLRLTPDQNEAKTIQAKGAEITDRDLLEKTFLGTESENSGLWTADVSEPITINGKIPVYLHVKSEFKEDIDLSLSVYLIDYCETPFMAFDPAGELESEPVQLPGDSLKPKTLVRWKMEEKTRKLITLGKIDLHNPDASYEPASAVKAEEPVESGQYYDYIVWLDPNYYTLQPGHKLELYIVPFGGYEKPFLYSDNFTEEQMREMNMNPDDYIRLSRNYSFTVENASSYALLPVTKDSGEFAPKIQPDPKEEDPTQEDSGSTSGETKEKIPATGDNNSTLVWIIVLVAAVVAISITITIIVIRKKKRK